MVRCKGITQKGRRCKLRCLEGVCHIHCGNKINDSVCSICLNTPKSKIVLECSHEFCKECIYQWMLQEDYNATCPMCRTVILNKKEFFEYAFLNKHYIRMSKHEVNISDMDQSDLDMLLLVGIYPGGYLTESDWDYIHTFQDKLIKDTISKIGVPSNEIHFVAKVNPIKHEYYLKNNKIYCFM